MSLLFLGSWLVGFVGGLAISGVFRFEPLRLADLAFAAGAGVAGVLLNEILKLKRRAGRGAGNLRRG